MSEETAGGAGSIGPETVEIVPESVVELLVTLYDRELGALRSQLESALRDAEEVEERLRRNPVAGIYDDDFEAKVLEQVANIALSITYEEPGPVGYASPDAKIPVADVKVTNDEPPEFAPATIEAEVPVAHVTVLTPSVNGNGSAPVQTRDASVLPEDVRPPVVSFLEPDTDVISVVQRPQPQRDAVPDSPRTVVVDRSWPVNGSVRSETLPPTIEPNMPARDVAPSPASVDVERRERVVKPQHSANGTNASRSRWLTKVPSRLLIQLGALVIIVGLLVLKLG